MSKNNDMGFFSISIAEKYGLTCAVIYQSIRYWIDYNQANKKNFRDGCYWVYNSVSAWHELFPYLTEKQIRTAIEELEADNLIVSSNHNKRKYDRTKWYTIPEKSKIHLPHRANDVAPQGEPIPLITTENTNTLPNNSDELFGVAEDISQPQDKTGKKNKQPKEVKQPEDIDYWKFLGENQQAGYVFYKSTGIVPIKREFGKWVKGFKELSEAEITVENIPKAVAEMRRMGLTIKAPQSILTIGKEIKAKNIIPEKAEKKWPLM